MQSCRRLFSACLVLALATSIADAQDSHITHGPILGRLSSHGVGVWARTNRAGEFCVKYGESPDRLDQTSPVVKTDVAHDCANWIHLNKLKPRTRYYYQVIAKGAASGPGGTFRTLPDADDYRHPQLNPRGLFNFRFEFACGNNQNPEHSIGPALPAFKTMNAKIRDSIDFAILNGDWLYEAKRDYTPQQWRRQVGVTEDQTPYVVQIVPTIVGVWENYKHFLTQGPPLAEWHRNMPSFFTFDDHEILNDVWGAGTPGLRDRRAVFRDIGVRAWYDYLGWSNPNAATQPVHFGKAQLKQGSDVLVDPHADFSKLDRGQINNLHVHWGGATAGVNDNALDEVGGEANAGVYEIIEVLDKHRLKIRPPAKEDAEIAYSIGRRSYYRVKLANCEFFFLDTRSQREMHDTRRPAQPGLSMLGKDQKAWLKKGMQQSDADFLFVISSVNFMVPHVGGGAVRATNKDDAWTVFLAEREEFIQFWDGLGKRVMVLTGDLHNSFVIKITDRVWEFASGPHNSQNHLVTDEGDRPPNGRFQYGPRACDIRWSTYFKGDIPRPLLKSPTYCVVQVNNVFDNPQKEGTHRWIAYPHPQVIFQYFDGKTGELRYAETLQAVD